MMNAPWVDALASALLHFLWQGALVAVCYAVVRCVTQSAARRYHLGCAALVLLLTAPVITFLQSDPFGRGTGASKTLPPLLLASPDQEAAGYSLTPDARVTNRALGWVVIAWFVGAAVFTGRFLGGWALANRMKTTHVRNAPTDWQSRFLRLQAHLRVARPIQLVVSALAQTPLVVGWLRPVILIPAGLLTGLPANHVEALLLHELAHVRRNDFLINLLQSIIESLLFYHPAVWWISGQVRIEREHCCDDAALAAGADPLTYARALTELEATRHRFAMAASGGPLTQRVARVLGLPRSRAEMLYAPAPAIHVALVALAACGLYAQLPLASEPLPAFDIAAIKPSKADSTLKIAFLPGDRLVVSHATLRFLIKIAYDLSDSQILGGPGWINSRRFDLEAKPEIGPTNQSKERTRKRLQRLLADRFELRLRNESKELDLFHLVVAKNGPKLTPSRSTGAPQLNAGKGRLSARRINMETFAAFLSEGQTGRPVANKTGLTGDFDFDLAWTPDPNLMPPDPNGVNAAPADMGPSIFTSVQQQLGLKLEPTKSAANCVLVEKATLPTEN